MFWIELVPAIIFFLALLVIPESPRYLVVSGQRDQANAVLTRLYGAEAAALKVEEINGSLAALLIMDGATRSTLEIDVADVVGKGVQNVGGLVAIRAKSKSPQEAFRRRTMSSASRTWVSVDLPSARLDLRRTQFVKAWRSWETS